VSSVPPPPAGFDRVTQPLRARPATPPVRHGELRAGLDRIAIKQVRPGAGLRRRVALGVAGLALLATVTGAVAMSAPSDRAPQPAAAAVALPGAAGTVERLRGLIPRGYSPQTCSPSPDSTADHAALTCGPNDDPGGPATATYQLFGQQTPMTAAFAAATTTFVRTDCPGRIQSPGPWHHAAGQTADGLVFCGYRDATAVVAWSTDDQRLLSVVRAGDTGPSLEQLFAWWSAHS
jgi:serine/threonine kinase PknH